MRSRKAADVLGREGLGDLLGELAQAQRVHRLGGGQVHLLHRLAGGLLDGTQQVLLARRHEQDGVAGTACTAGAADAVDVGLGVVRDVVVDHVADALHVKATGRDVGGHEDVDAAFLQRVHSALALLLRDVAVDGGSLEAAGLQLVSQVLGGHLGAHEGDDAVELFNLEDAGHGVELVRAHDLQVPLAGVGAGGGLGLDRDLGRVVQVLLGHPADLARHGGREQRHLAVRRGLLEDLLHVFGEAHAQHFVGLVQHQVLELGQVQGTLGDVVDHAAGGTHNNLGAAAQAGELGAVGGAAVDGQDGEVVDVLGVGGEGLGNLERQLAGGGQDQGLGLAGRAVEVVELGQAGQCRYCECCSLTGAGLGEAHDVAAFEQQRDGCCLDGGGLLVADILQGGQDAAVDAEVGELDAVFSSSSALAAGAAGASSALAAGAAALLRPCSRSFGSGASAAGRRRPRLRGQRAR